MAEQSGTWQLAGQELKITSLETVYWPDEGITKGDLLTYYREMAEVLLPYFVDRPATLRVCPKGVQDSCHYRRDLANSAPSWLRGFAYRPETTQREIRLPLIDDAAGLIWLANTGAIEFHLWACTVRDLSTPDQVIFDLDPGDRVDFADVLQAAMLLRQFLDELGLHGYAKTSGGLGLHVYVPIAPDEPFDDVRAWVKNLAERLANDHPELIAVPRRGTHQGSQVTVDYAQNSIGRNTAAPYTVRARPGAPVSTPVSWDEVAAGRIRPADFTLRTVPERVRKQGDPFAPVLAGGQRLPKL